MSEISQVVYVGGERVESSEITKHLEYEAEPSQVVYIGGMKKDSGNKHIPEPNLGVFEIENQYLEDIVENGNLNADTEPSFSTEHNNEEIADTIAEVKDVTESRADVSLPGNIAGQGLPSQNKSDVLQEYTEFKMDRDKDLVNEPIDITQRSENEYAHQTQVDALKEEMEDPLDSKPEQDEISSNHFIHVEDSDPEKVRQPMSQDMVESHKTGLLNMEETKPRSENVEILKTVSKDNIKAVEKETDSGNSTQQTPPASTAVDDTPYDTTSNTSDSTASIITSDVTMFGVVNTAFVDEEVQKEIEKKHQRTLLGDLVYSDGSQQVKDENGPNRDAENPNPPIITQGSKPVLTEKEYSEYFIHEEEKAKSFRGETEPLYETNTKDKGSTNWAKFCCWIFILALLAGAIAVGVMIGIGVISLEPIRKVKESRKLAMDAENINSVKLFEVTDKNAPNILTNNPDFFSARKNSSKGESDTEKDTGTDMNNNTDNTDIDIKSDNKTFMIIQKISPPPQTDSVTTKGKEEEYISTSQESVSEIKTTIQPETGNKDSEKTPLSESKISQEKTTMPTIETRTEQGTLGSKQVVEETTVVGLSTSEDIPITIKPTKLPSEEPFELLMAEEVLKSTFDQVTTEQLSNSEVMNKTATLEEKTSIVVVVPDKLSLSDIVTERFVTTTIPVRDIKDDVKEEKIEVTVSEPRELVLPEA